MNGSSKIDIPGPPSHSAPMASGLVGDSPDRIRGHLADRRRAGMAAGRLPQLLAIDHGHESGSTSPAWRRHQRGQAVVAINPTLANGLLAALETAVGLSLITNTLSRWALRVSVLLAALIWVFGQGLGMVFMAGAPHVPSGPLFVLPRPQLLRALPARPVPARFSPAV